MSAPPLYSLKTTYFNDNDNNSTNSLVEIIEENAVFYYN